MVQDNIALNGACPGEMIEKALAIARAVIKQPDIFLIDEALTVLIHQRKRRF
jgi:ABC-type molybdate transport system ATPase subunit